ncbi:hypothetical protein M0R45_019112 [Rubus argutus]|uniref:Uncharacterized protein n=1 Tax=Rubus argutus TaxID=59490 RepID=A0AAW1X6V6_RUBAR
MTKKAYCGVITVAPSSKINVSDQVQSEVKSSYNDQYCGVSSNFTKSYNEGDFVDRRSGNVGYKQEAKYTSTDKYVDKAQGCTTVYKTQLKVTKSVYTKNSASATKSSYKRLNYY